MEWTIENLDWNPIKKNRASTHWWLQEAPSLLPKSPLDPSYPTSSLPATFIPLTNRKVTHYTHQQTSRRFPTISLSPPLSKSHAKHAWPSSHMWSGWEAKLWSLEFSTNFSCKSVFSSMPDYSTRPFFAPSQIVWEASMASKIHWFSLLVNCQLVVLCISLVETITTTVSSLLSGP